MKITISGTPGSGKDTVGRIICKKLNLKFYSIGDLRGDMALKRGMTLEQLNELGEKQDWTDKEVDNYQKEIGEKEDNFVIVGRTGFHFIPSSIKVFLEADIKTCAERILKDKRPDEPYYSLDEIITHIKKRKISDSKRYKKYYNLDVYDRSNYDLVIDTTHKTPEEVAEEIILFSKRLRSKSV